MSTRKTEPVGGDDVDAVNDDFGPAGKAGPKEERDQYTLPCSSRCGFGIRKYDSTGVSSEITAVALS